MKALVKKYPERGLWFEDVAEPVCGDGDVKIKKCRVILDITFCKAF